MDLFCFWNTQTEVIIQTIRKFSLQKFSTMKLIMYYTKCKNSYSDNLSEIYKKQYTRMVIFMKPVAHLFEV